MQKKILYQLCILAVYIFAVGSGAAFCQKTIRGIVTDAETGEPLPAANIHIEDTYRGTITNENGAYTLTIPDSLLPAVLNVRYLGYRSLQRTITMASDAKQDFPLRVSVFEMETIVVTDENPAERIMREVIRRKQEWRGKLNTYRAEAYTRQVLSNDTAIVSITESVSEVFWDKRQGHREVQKSKRQTDNIKSDQNFAGVSYLPNFYDDDITVAGFEMVGVTHPDALDYYDFSIRDTTGLDGRAVFGIEVIPVRKLQPLFQGMIYVLDKEFVLLEVDLRPNEVVVFPPPIKSFNTAYRQQFSNFGRDFWLPVDVRINADIKIAMTGLEFPRINFRQISRISNYSINTNLPDSLYKKKRRFSVDSATVTSDSLLVKEAEAVPLSVDEEKAYATLDSTATLEEAFKPTGFLARFVDDEESAGSSFPGGNILGVIPGSLAPVVRYNRVDEFYLGMNYEVDLFRNTELQLDGGYSTGYSEWGYGGMVETRLFSINGFSQSAGVLYKAATVSRFSSSLYEPGFATLTNLLGRTDYFDYYRSEGYGVFNRFSYQPLDLSLEAGFRSMNHSTLPAVTAYDLLGNRNSLQVNPEISEGRINTLYLEGGYNLAEDYNFGVTQLKRIRAGWEYSSPLLDSDFDFTTYSVGIDWSFPTFFKRRFLPNTLDLQLSAGTSGGNLPLQKLGVVDGTMGIFTPFGSLKTLRWRPYEGEQYFSLIAEHNFRTIPFELMGLQSVTGRSLGLIVFGGIAGTRIPERYRVETAGFGYIPNETSGIHIEAGISINGILGLFRLDLAQRLDSPGFRVGISTARIF